MYGPGVRCKSYLVMGNMVCTHVSGLLLGVALGMPAASMRFAHLVLSNWAAWCISRPWKQDPEVLVW